MCVTYVYISLLSDVTDMSCGRYLFFEKRKIDTNKNESDLLTKIREADQFEKLCDRCMVLQASPAG